MNFLDNIKGFDFSNSLLEETLPDDEAVLENILKRIKDEVGGAEDEAIIDGILDDIEYGVLDKPEEEKYYNVIKAFASPDKIEFFEKYRDSKKESINSLSNDLLKNTKNVYSPNDETRDKSNKDFIKQASALNLEMDRMNKLIQIYSINSEKGVAEEAKSKTDEIAKSADSIQKAIDAYRKASEQLLSTLDKKAESDESEDILIDQVEDTLNKSGMSIITINIGGKEKTVEQEIKKIKEKEDANKPKETKEQREFIKKTISRLRDSSIPEYVDGSITKKGGFFENILQIKSEYDQVLMDLITRKAIDFGENNMHLESENPDVKYQIAYLDATRAFLDYMIETYIPYKKDRDKLKRLVDNLYLQKASYIKNKNLSRKINMSDFAGLKIKAEIKVPLYKTVNIPITNEDLVANSKFTKFKNAISSLKGMTGYQKSYVDSAIASKNKAQNRAILQLVNNMSRSVAGAVGGQAAKDKTTRFFQKTGDLLDLKQEAPKVKESLSEDMLMPTSGPNQPGLIFDTPQSVAGGMDTFAKLGPGKKKKSKRKKKKKKNISLNAIMTFDDFINK